MKRLLLALLLALPALAQTPVISGVSTDSISHTAARVMWTTDISALADEVRFSVSPAAAGDMTSPRKTATSYTVHSILLSGLAPSTTYTYKVCSAAGTANEACSTPDSTFTTAAAPANRFADPTLPSGIPADAGLPTITGSTFTVANCADLQNELNLAAAADTSLNHQVKIPAGVECDGNYTLPAKSGVGTVVVRPDTPDAQLPPTGVRLTSDYPDSLLAILGSVTANQGAINVTADTSGWYLFGIKATNSYIASDYLTVTAATNATPIQITTSTAHGYATNDIVQIGGIVGNTAANRFNWKITVVDANNFTLNGSVGNGAWVSGGWVVKASTTQSYMINFASSALSRMTVDRCRIQGRGFPSRTYYGIWTGKCTTCTVVNSEFKDIGGWLAADPDGSLGTVTTVGSPYAPVAIDMSYAHSLLIQNNLVANPGISVFAQAPVVMDAPTSDVVVRRNTFKWDTKYKLTELTCSTDSTTETCVQWYSRQPLEFKRGVRLHIAGNEFDSTWTNGFTGNYPSVILLAPHTSDNATTGTQSQNTITDVTIRNNYFHGVPGAVTMGGAEYYNLSSRDNAGVGARVLISNNVMGTDGSNISRSSGTTTNYIAAGSPFYFYNGGEDYRVEHNTAFAEIGKWPGFLTFGSGWYSGFKFTDNLMLGSNAAGAPIVSASDGGAGTGFYTASPKYTTTNALTTVQTVFTKTPGTPDTAVTIANNIIIPGVTDANLEANYGNTTYSWSVANCNSYWTSFTGFTCLGSDTTTANAKLALVHWLGATDFTLKGDSPAASANRAVAGDKLNAGADWGAIQAAMGWVRNARMSAIGTTTATVAYTRPGDVACVVEYGTSATFGTGTRVTDTGAVLANTVYVPVTVSLTGLTTATGYNVRVLCPAQQPTLTFTTN